MREDKNKKRGMLARFTTEWMTNRQLKAYHAMGLAVEAVLFYLIFVEMAAVYGPLVSAVFSISVYGLIVCFDMYLVTKVLQVRAIRHALRAGVMEHGEAREAGS